MGTELLGQAETEPEANRKREARRVSKLALHGRVVAAMMRREMITRYGRSSGGYIWAIAEPVAYIALFTVIFSQIAKAPPIGDKFVLFFATGYMGYFFYRSVADETGAAILVNKTLLTFPRVTPYDALVARALLQFITMVVVALVIFGGIKMFLDRPHSLRIEYIMLGAAISAVIGFGVGTLNSVLFVMAPTYRTMFGVLSRPLMILSGVFYLPTDLPQVAQDILWYNPIVHAVEVFRQGFYLAYDSAFVSYIYLYFWMILPLFFGLLLLRKYGSVLVEEQ